jgi:hypothetical protein
VELLTRHRAERCPGESARCRTSSALGANDLQADHRPAGRREEHPSLCVGDRQAPPFEVHVISRRTVISSRADQAPAHRSRGQQRAGPDSLIPSSHLSTELGQVQQNCFGSDGIIACRTLIPLPGGSRDRGSSNATRIGRADGSPPPARKSPSAPCRAFLPYRDRGSANRSGLSAAS